MHKSGDVDNNFIDWTLRRVRNYKKILHLTLNLAESDLEAEKKISVVFHFCIQKF